MKKLLLLLILIVPFIALAGLECEEGYKVEEIHHEAVWGCPEGYVPNTLSNPILRRMGECRKIVQTNWGYYYRFTNKVIVEDAWNEYKCVMDKDYVKPEPTVRSRNGQRVLHWTENPLYREDLLKLRREIELYQLYVEKLYQQLSK